MTMPSMSMQGCNMFWLPAPGYCNGNVLFGEIIYGVQVSPLPSLDWNRDTLDLESDFSSPVVCYDELDLNLQRSELYTLYRLLWKQQTVYTYNWVSRSEPT